MDKQKTGELIKKVRIEKGYTQIELGDMLGVSNKAVSRWENGDSFPDIGVLESLSKILDLKIQDIVIGEAVENGCDTAVTDIVRVVQIQRREKTRNTITMGVGLILIVYLLFMGYYSMSGAAINWKMFSYYCSLAAILLVVSIKCAFDKESLNPFRSKISKLFAGFSLGTGIYSSILMCSTMMMVNQEKTPFNMKLSSVGPFLNNQLIIIFVINIIIITIECFRINYNDATICLDIYFGVAVIYLTLVYSDLLHRLTSPEELCRMIVLDSIIILIETIIMIAVTLIVKKHTKHKA